MDENIKKEKKLISIQLDVDMEQELRKHCGLIQSRTGKICTITSQIRKWIREGLEKELENA